MAYVNLLPWRLDRDERMRQRSYWQLAGITASVFLVVALMYQQRATNLNLLKAANSELRFEQAELQTQLDKTAQAKASLQQLKFRIRVAGHLHESRRIAGQILQSMVVMMPAEARLTQLEKVGEKLMLRGSSQSQAGVASLYRALSRSAAFTDAHLSEVVSGSKSGKHRFRLALGLTATGGSDVGPTK